jgi:hypothetical protein
MKKQLRKPGTGLFGVRRVHSMARKLLSKPGVWFAADETPFSNRLAETFSVSRLAFDPPTGTRHQRQTNTEPGVVATGFVAISHELVVVGTRSLRLPVLYSSTPDAGLCGYAD